jgi:hypothetical protein
MPFNHDTLIKIFMPGQSGGLHMPAILGGLAGGWNKLGMGVFFEDHEFSEHLQEGAFLAQCGVR